MHVAIADKMEALAAVCRRYGMARLEVFGSAARGTDFDPQTSDADFLVEFDPDSGLTPFDQFFDLAEALSTTSGRPVDLVEAGRNQQSVSARGHQSISRACLCVPTSPNGFPGTAASSPSATC